MRHAAKRDSVEPEIFAALQKAGAKPTRGTDVDIYARSLTDLTGVLIEVKKPNARNNLRPIQKRLKELFQGRYCVVTSVSEALAAVGVKS